MEQKDITETGPVSYKDLQNLNNANFSERLNNIPEAPEYTFDRVNELYAPLMNKEILFHTLLKNWGESIFDASIADASQVENLLDIRAENQGTLLKLGAGVGKLITTTAATIIDGTLGTLNGFGLGIYNLFDDNPNTTFISGFWDNSTINAMSAFLESMENILPNYRTEYELNSPWYDLLLTANFWGDSVLKNAGFTIGTVATALLTQGLGNYAMGVGKISKMARGLNLINSTGEATKFGKVANWTVTNFLSANGESVIEAANSVKASKDALDYEIEELKNSLYKKLDAWYYESLDDPMLDKLQLDIEYLNRKNAIDLDINKIYLERKKVLTQAGNTVWGLNMATLIPTNNINLAGIVRGGYHSGKSALETAKRTVGGEVVNDKSKFLKGILLGISGFAVNEIEHGTAKVAGRTLLNAAAEGTQEGLLKIISSTSEILTEAKLNKFTKDNTLLGAELNDEAQDEYTDYFRAMHKAYEDNFGSIDSPGWEEVVVGALMGAFGVPMIKSKYSLDKKTGRVRSKLGLGFVGGVSEAIDDVYGNINIDKQRIGIVNDFLQKEETRNNIKNAIASISINNTLQKALKDSDINTYKNAEIMALTKDALRARLLGVLDEYLGVFDEISKGLSDLDVNELKASTVQLSNGKSFLESKTSDEIKDYYQGKAKRSKLKVEDILDYFDYNLLHYANKFDIDISDIAIQELTFRDALSMDLSRRIDLINNEILNLNQESPTYEEELKEKQNTIFLLQSLKKDIDDSLRFARNNPKEFSKEIRNIIQEYLNIETGKDADKVLLQYEKAKSLKDINNIYHHSDLSFRGTVFEKARNNAPKEVRDLMDLYHNFLNTIDSVDNFVDDYFKNIPEEHRQNNIDFFKELFRVIFEDLFEEENPILDKDVIIDELNKGIKYFEDTINLNSKLDSELSAIDLHNATASKNIFSALKDHLNLLLDTMESGNHEEQKTHNNTAVTGQQEEQLEKEEGNLGFGESSEESNDESSQKTIGDTFENFVPQKANSEETRELLKKEFGKYYNLLKLSIGNNKKEAVENAKLIISLLKDKGFKLKENGAKAIKSLLDSMSSDERKELSEWYNKKYNKVVTPKTKTKVKVPAQTLQVSNKSSESNQAKDDDNYLYGNQADLYVIKDGIATIRKEIPDEVKNVKYLYFIDNFLSGVLLENPNIPIHYAKKREVDNWIFLSIDLNDVDEDNREWINKNKGLLTIINSHVIIGVLGFNPNQEINKLIFYNVKNHLDEEFKNVSAPWLFSESTNNIKTVQGGKIVTQLPNQELKTLKPIGPLFTDKSTNPYGLSTDDIKMTFIIEDRNNPKGIRTEGMNPSNIDFTLYNAGTVLMYIPDATGKWIPTTVVPNYLFSLDEDTYIRTKVNSIINLLFDPNNSDALSTYLQLYDTINMSGIYYNGKDSKHPNTIGVSLNKLEYLNFDLNDKNTLEELKEKFIELLKQLNPKVKLSSADLNSANSILYDGTMLTNLANLGTMDAKFTIYGVNKDMSLIKTKKEKADDGQKSNTNKTTHPTNIKINHYDYFYRKTADGIEFFDEARNKIEDPSTNKELKDIMNIKQEIGVKKVVIKSKGKPNSKGNTYWEVGNKVYFEEKPDVFISVEGDLIELYRKKLKNANISNENSNTETGKTTSLWDEGNPNEEKKTKVGETVAYVNTINGSQVVFSGKYISYDKSKHTALVGTMTLSGIKKFTVSMDAIAPNYLKGETVLYVNKAVDKNTEYSGEITALFARDGIPYAKIKNIFTKKYFDIPMKDIKRLDEGKKLSNNKENSSNKKGNNLSPKYINFKKGKTVVFTNKEGQRVIAELLDNGEVAGTGNIKYKYRNKVTGKEGIVWHSTITEYHEIIEPETLVYIFNNTSSELVTIVEYIASKNEDSLGHYSIIDSSGMKKQVWESQVIKVEDMPEELLQNQPSTVNTEPNTNKHKDGDIVRETSTKDGVTTTKYTTYKKTKSGLVKPISKSIGPSVNSEFIDLNSFANKNDFTDFQLLELREKNGNFTGTILATSKATGEILEFEVSFTENPDKGDTSSAPQSQKEFNVFDEKDRVKASKLLNKENIIDARITVDGGIEIFVKLEEAFPHLAGVITFNTNRKRWEVGITRLSKYNSSELTEEERKKYIEGDLSFVTQETAKKVINHYIPKDLQEYYTSGQYEKDNKEKLKYQDSLEEKGLSLDKRIELLRRTSIGEEGVVRDRWGIYSINEWTNETNYFTDSVALQDQQDNTSDSTIHININSDSIEKEFDRLASMSEEEYYNGRDTRPLQYITPGTVIVGPKVNIVKWIPAIKKYRGVSKYIESPEDAVLFKKYNTNKEFPLKQKIEISLITEINKYGSFDEAKKHFKEIVDNINSSANTNLSEENIRDLINSKLDSGALILVEDLMKSSHNQNLLQTSETKPEQTEGDLDKQAEEKGYIVKSNLSKNSEDNILQSLEKISGAAGEVTVNNLKSGKELDNSEKSNKFAEFFMSLDGNISDIINSICETLGLDSDNASVTDIQLKISEKGFSINTVLDIQTLKELDDNLKNCKK